MPPFDFYDLAIRRCCSPSPPLSLSANKKFKWNKNKNPPSNAAVAHCFHSSASFHAIIIFRVMILVKAKNMRLSVDIQTITESETPSTKRPRKNEFVKIKFYNVQFTSRQTICMKRKWLSFSLVIKNTKMEMWTWSSICCDTIKNKYTERRKRKLF